MEKEKKGLNLSSLTTCDPSSNSKHKKTTSKKFDLPFKSYRKIPKNTPQSSKASSLIHSGSIFNSFHFISTLSSESIQELSNFKDQKIEEYKKTLENCLNHSTPVITKQSPYIIAKREKLRIINEKGDKKREKLSKQREFTEIKRIKQSQSMKLSNLYYTMAKKNEKIKRQKGLIEKIQRDKEKKEQVRLEQEQKSLVKENIKNFYTDRIEEVKKKIEEEKIRSKTLKYEDKKNKSMMKKEAKMLKKKIFYLV